MLGQAVTFFLLDWWRRRRRVPLGHLHFILHTRAGCHLCDEAAAVLERAARHHRFNLQVVDIDTDSTLQQRYGLDVPVVTVNGKVRFRGQVNAVLLERLLYAAAHGATKR